MGRCFDCETLEFQLTMAARPRFDSCRFAKHGWKPYSNPMEKIFNDLSDSASCFDGGLGGDPIVLASDAMVGDLPG